MSETTKKRVRPDKILFATGESGILNKLYKQAELKRFKQLKRTDRDNDEVFSLICHLNEVESLMKSQPLNLRMRLEKTHVRPLKAQIYYAIVRQGYISRDSLKRFKFKVQKLVIEIEYRNLIEKFIEKHILNDDVIREYLSDKAEEGQYVETFEVSNECTELNDQIKDAMMYIDDDLPKSTIDQNRLKLYEMVKQERTEQYNKRSKIENICYHIHYDHNTIIQPPVKAFNENRLLKLGTSSLEKVITFYCKCMNEVNEATIKTQRKAIRQKYSRDRYLKKKQYTASEKKAYIQVCKSKGMTQNETATLTTFNIKTVKRYWN